MNGKEGFYLRSEFGNYLIEPQVDLGRRREWLFQVEPILFSTRSVPSEGELPIVVFTDGYEYHADPNAGLRQVRHSPTNGAHALGTISSLVAHLGRRARTVPAPGSPV